MKRWSSQRAALFLVALLVLLGVGTQLAVSLRLRADWNDLVATAAGHKLLLSGTPNAGWTALTVTDVRVVGAAFLPDARMDELTLSRPIWNLFHLAVVSTRPLTLNFPDGRQLDIWSRGVRAVRVGHQWRFAGAGIGAALHGCGPDDVTSLEAVRGDVDDTPDGWELRVRAREAMLPARGTWPNGRLVENVAGALELGGAAVPGRVAIPTAEISWGGQRGRMAFAGALDDHGELGGRGEVSLGPGWAATLKRAHAAGVINAGETEAAIGFLGLLSPDERSPVAIPVTLEAGRVRVGRSTLFVLPSFPVGP